MLVRFSGYGAASAFSAGDLRLQGANGDTVVGVDSDGGGNSWQPLVTLTGVSLLQTDTSNFLL